MKITKLKLIVGTFLFLTSAVLYAQPSPVGVWKTIDDKSGEARSYVKIWDNGQGVLYGKITKLLNTPDADTAICEKCTDDRKDKKVVGLEILRGLKNDPDKPLRWNQGTVLDPENGKVYKGYVEVTTDNKTLKLRGYVGVPLFGRNQFWHRVE